MNEDEIEPKDIAIVGIICAAILLAGVSIGSMVIVLIANL